MSSFGDVKDRRALCPSCQRTTRVETLFEKEVVVHDDYGDIYVTEYYCFECRGCETVFLCQVQFSSEDHVEVGPNAWDFDRSYKYLPEMVVSKFPRLHWNPWNFSHPELLSLLNETYTAAENGLYTLAASGVRTTFDIAAIALGVSANKSFAEKLKELRTSGRISDENKIALEILVDAGSAAIHRGWNPDQQEIATLIGALNSFLDTQFVELPKLKSLKENVPQRGK